MELLPNVRNGPGTVCQKDGVIAALAKCIAGVAIWPRICELRQCVDVLLQALTSSATKRVERAQQQVIQWRAQLRDLRE